ncbi:hypothetical protein V1520DRAFT_342991 [Lipomyces starkeyi]|uniref:GSKIP domain-containing protein n=1 Tax=Lipomyces starkeyi NRRL Y-11557 TaxID=675824 RepID=A0A1E3PX79_LIPST|nr:hypothetical protein LIPSTDRAFT_30548 [Lipomyces starkeyi NRRL Y-11557]
MSSTLSPSPSLALDTSTATYSTPQQLVVMTVTSTASPVLSASPSSPYSFAPAFSLADDVAALASEYSPMLLDVAPVPSTSNISTEVEILTKEHTHIRLAVSPRGWTVERIESDDSSVKLQCHDLIGSTFEDPEAVLLRVSPAFAREWQSRLVEQLEMLAS